MTSVKSTVCLATEVSGGFNRLGKHSFSLLSWWKSCSRFTLCDGDGSAQRTMMSVSWWRDWHDACNGIAPRPPSSLWIYPSLSTSVAAKTLTAMTAAKTTMGTSWRTRSRPSSLSEAVLSSEVEAVCSLCFALLCFASSSRSSSSFAQLELCDEPI